MHGAFEGRLVHYVAPDRKRPGARGRFADWVGERPVAQLLLFVGLAGIGALLWTALATNLARLGLTPGFAFLGHAANFEIGEAPIAYAAGDSYGRAILAGLANTVLVSAAGCLLATILGVLLGVARLSDNPLLSGTVAGFIEIVRNTPLLLQLFFWNATLHALPGPRQAFAPLPGVKLSNRGLAFPWFSDDGSSPAVAGATLALLALVGLGLALRRRRRGPAPQGGAATAVGLALLGPAFVAALAGAPLALELPQLAGFNIRGGLTLTPEFAALLIGLTVNASAGIAETVRGGILSVPRGQWEAARAVGLPPMKVLRLVVLPQALRVIVPVLASSWLSLTKNSSLAVAIGFPDLVSILNTTANVTGQSLETITLMMGLYLTLSLLVSVTGNAWNERRLRREGR
ncbi:ABC transporter permease subunit [Siculibacillus lacustris]|uniref:ABC transporter permease subunit n=1 Tax=Siculibacillus lacustris TaxID=1549641 RepID=A0A4Q9VTQ4_9HYPH|nr:ABC transporter permease subunit [Siculibacillus lacustris]TBW39498.1 ABC transporter permease subunit [Siculibacillus lacustris]